MGRIREIPFEIKVKLNAFGICGAEGNWNFTFS
jgi:hypothetical protein